MVAAQDDGDVAVACSLRDLPRNPLASLLDLHEEARTRVARRGRLRNRRLDVAPVKAFETEPREAVVQTRIANRGRAHVDATASGAQVERSPDDCELSFPHGGEG